MSDTDRCSREELDRAIEWILEVRNESREKLKDEDAAYELLMWLYKIHEEYYFLFIPGNFKNIL